MTATVSLGERYLTVKDRIGRGAAKAGARADQVLLVAVTKNAEPDQIRDLIRMGHVDFGENRVPHLLQRAAIIGEWLGRHKTLPGTSWNTAPLQVPEPRAGTQVAQPLTPGVRWHMIGHLQRNKAKKVLEVCRLVHSVDSLRLAEEIQGAAIKLERTVDVLLQVNTSGERTKGGCAVAAAVHLAEQIDTMVEVRLRGLMTMAPYSENPEDSRRTFARCRELFYEVRDSGYVGRAFNILSMGMSGDFEVAIQEGANLVRIGSAIFGEPRADQRDEGPHADDDPDAPPENDGDGDGADEENAE